MVADLRERLYVSQYAQDVLALDIQPAGVPTDPDDQAVSLVFALETGDPFAEPQVLPTPVAQGTATRQDVGLYDYSLTSAATSQPGNYTVTWTYSLNGPQTYVTYVQVGPAAPPYDSLDAAMKEIVDRVWVRFADLYDSPDGGPNLQTYFQTHFGRGRIAQLLQIAVGRLNTVAQPYQTYTIAVPGQFPVAQWGSLLETALYVETLKHLVRSYVEQPNFLGGAVTRLDRRDYMDRWMMIQRDEEQTLKQQLDVFKISNMGLGRPQILVSGGVFGRYGPTRFAGSVAARPRMWARFY